MFNNIFFGDTNDIIIEIKKNAKKHQIDILKKMHPNAVIIIEEGTMSTISSSEISYTNIINNYNDVFCWNFEESLTTATEFAETYALVA